MKTKRSQDAAGLLASEWEALFRSAGIKRDALETTKSRQSRATFIGSFLNKNLGREVSIEVAGRTGKATLGSVNAGKRQKRYYFEVVWEDQDSLTGHHAHDSDGADDLEPSGASKGRDRPATRQATRQQPRRKWGHKGRAPRGNEENWT